MLVTDRAERVMREAHRAATEADQTASVFHVLIGALREGTGPLQELRETMPDLILALWEKAGSFTIVPIDYALKRAEDIANRYRQVYINEGHLVEAALMLEKHAIQDVLSEEQLQRIIKLVCSPRDMSVSLRTYRQPALKEAGGAISRAKLQDESRIIEYVIDEFGERWVERVRECMQMTPPTVYVAERNNRLIGFACFLADHQTARFGPMGVTHYAKNKGIGYNLLHRCLQDLYMQGVTDIRIEEAGPVEFYEKACGAGLISK
ncbi:GNAT family N-acetyltransferase [Bacillus daqingensis]|uniref:GNAT family N-acetyltransferase n=1 Tax=Bacillus daqingensis TaxID=872396 RepID=A0ABV9NYF6_9BACI